MKTVLFLQLGAGNIPHNRRAAATGRAGVGAVIPGACGGDTVKINAGGCLFLVLLPVGFGVGVAVISYLYEYIPALLTTGGIVLGLSAIFVVVAALLILRALSRGGGGGGGGDGDGDGDGYGVSPDAGNERLYGEFARHARRREHYQTRGVRK